MKKRWIALLTAVCLATAPVSVLAEETDYSYLEDMSVKELKALRDAINELLGDGGETVDNRATVVEGTYYKSMGFDKDAYFIFTPYNDQKTMGAFKAVNAIGSSEEAIGEYSIVADILTIQYTAAGVDFQLEYAIRGDYIIRTGFVYDEYVPDEEFFSGTIGYINFQSDGTCVKNIKTSLNGKYRREGDVILIDYEDGTSGGYYVLNNQMCIEGFKKAE